jgi:hypothetical protein
MSETAELGYQPVVDDICSLPWRSLTSHDMVRVAWAYYFFSVQFRESLKTAREILPTDEKLQHLEREECDTDNLSPWPGVAEIGERMNHDEFMRRTLSLTPIDAEASERLTEVGQSYLRETRALPAEVRARAIASYEDGGLEKVFTAMLQFEHWDNPMLRAFRHFLSEHVRFDSDPDQGHGALSRHLAPDERVLPLWDGFRRLLVTSVPALRGA